MDLTTAIALITEDYDWAIGETPNATQAVQELRETLADEDFSTWDGLDDMSQDTIQAYEMVRDASEEDLTDALR